MQAKFYQELHENNTYDMQHLDVPLFIQYLPGTA